MLLESTGLEGHSDLRTVDRATGRMYIAELRREGGSEQWTTSYGVYHDRFARIDGRWWFARRRYQSLARTGRAEIFPFPTRPGFD